LQTTKVHYPKNKTRPSTALTLLEMVIALAMMATVFAAILPLFRNIRISWDSKQAAAETLQNGRVLVDHLNRKLSKAVKITAVSDPSTNNGYIEFEDNDGNNLKYDVANSYVRFGAVGDLSDLAGPISKLQFTCYDACDLDTSITDVDSIRFVKAETTLTNPTATGQDKTLIASAYLRTNGNVQPITKEPPLEFDVVLGASPALFQIDSTHYLCAYEGPGNDGWAFVLTVDTGTWDITKGTLFEFDGDDGRTPALSQISTYKYLCAYSGVNDDGFAVMLTVNPVDWTITMGTALEFDTNNGQSPALSKIDNTHHLCAYQGRLDDGWAVVLTVDPDTGTITTETPFEFETKDCHAPALSQIDATHFLCAYEGPQNDGWAVVLSIDTGTWNITKETPFEYDPVAGQSPGLYQVDSTHYLCAYGGPGDDGWVVFLTVDTGTWEITKETPFEHNQVKGITPDVQWIDSNRYFLVYEGSSVDGFANILTVDANDWTITADTALEYDTIQGAEPALEKVDDEHYLCAYQGEQGDGWSVVLAVDTNVRP
jgi:type II secretory pathway pseudopilin PulG